MSKNTSLLLFFIILFGFWLRWQNLEERPIHYDEAVYGVYSLYYGQDHVPSQYHPALHGPFLYQIMHWSFSIFGINKWALRFPATFLSSLLLLAPLAFKRILSPKIILLMTAFLSFSPTLVYWGRFLRHDHLVFLSIFGMLFALYGPYKRATPFIFLLSLTFHFCVKENAYIHTLLILGFIIYEHFLYKFFRPFEKSFFSFIIEHICLYKKTWAVGTLLSAFLYSWYYSDGFSYSGGILDGLYRKSLIYWYEQHSIEAVGGPFSYNFFINTLHESWWAPFIILHLIFFYKKRSWRPFVGLLVALTLGLLGYFFFDKNPFWEITSLTFKIKIPKDFILFSLLAFHAISSTTLYLLEGHRNLGICAYAFFSTLFTYSFLVEKVPWLALYPLIVGIIFFCLLSEKYLNLKALLIIAPFFALNLWWNLMFPRPPFLEHLHLPSQYEKELITLNYQLSKGKTLLALPNISAWHLFWPLTWYIYQNYSSISYTAKWPLSDYDYLLQNSNHNSLWDPKWKDYPSPHSLKKLEKTHIVDHSLFLVDYFLNLQTMTLSNAFTYYWSKRPWDGPWTQKMLLLKKRELD